jgi:hypothetical protein
MRKSITLAADQKQLSNWGRKSISFASSQQHLRTAGPLISKAIGVTDLSDRVLTGVITDDLQLRLQTFPGIVSYIERRAAGTVQAISNDEMIELAEDLIRATARWSISVGNSPIQTSTIKPGEQPQLGSKYAQHL